MRRICLLQGWYNPPDAAGKEDLHDSPMMRRFARLDLVREPVQDETTVCKVRHVLEARGLGARMLEQDNSHQGSEWEESFVRLIG